MTLASRPLGAERKLFRRSFLIMGAGLGVGLAGCTDDSPVRPEPSSSAGSSTPPPPALPGTVDGAALESSLAEVAAWISTTYSDDLDRAEERLLDQLRQAHEQHAAVLTAPDPLTVEGPLPTPSSSPSASPSPTADASASQQPPVDLGDDLDEAFAALATMESDIAAGHQRLAIDPQVDQDQHRQQLSLLWGSLAAAGFSYSEACQRRRDPGRTLTGVQRVVVDLPEPVAALQNLVEQVYAVIFGYQTAIAKLDGDLEDHARNRLRDLRDLRDHLSDRLADDEQDVPAPHAGYQLPVQPTSGTKASTLIGTLETGLLPFFGQWLATADEDDRPEAAQNMISTALEAQLWTAKISVWPGWPVDN